MATKSSTANPIANFYEAQTAATAEIAHAALNGMQRLQKLTLQAMRASTDGQLSLAQSIASMREGGSMSGSVSEAAAPAAEQGARYQREMVQAIAEMNNDIVRASYSMIERMREALGSAMPGSLPMAAALPGLPMRDEGMTNTLEMVDSAMRQWQTAVQQMIETPAVATAVVSAQEDRPRAASAATARKSKRPAKRKPGARAR